MTMNDPAPLQIQKGTYRHSKTGKLYEVVGIALQTETNDQLVVYRPLYESNYELFARPQAMFSGSVEVGGQTVPRFQKLD